MFVCTYPTKTSSLSSRCEANVHQYSATECSNAMSEEANHRVLTSRVMELLQQRTTVFGSGATSYMFTKMDWYGMKRVLLPRLSL